jgi:hypothetical protein
VVFCGDGRGHDDQAAQAGGDCESVAAHGIGRVTGWLLSIAESAG